MTGSGLGGVFCVERSADHVSCPATPSGDSPFAFWKSLTWCSVPAPKIPSGSQEYPCWTSWLCNSFTSLPLLPFLIVFTGLTCVNVVSRAVISHSIVTTGRLSGCYPATNQHRGGVLS